MTGFFFSPTSSLGRSHIRPGDGGILLDPKQLPGASEDQLGFVFPPHEGKKWGDCLVICTTLVLVNSCVSSISISSRSLGG